MKPPVVDSVSVAMATKCSSGVSATADHMMHMRSHRGHHNAYANHRKSAVELLEASKGEYVKSTKVLNHRQELKHPENLTVGNRDVLSLPVCAGKQSPSDETPCTSRESPRNTHTSGDPSTPKDNSRNRQISGDPKTCKDNLKNRHISGDPKTCKDNLKSRQLSGDLNSPDTPNDSPRIRQTSEHTNITGDSPRNRQTSEDPNITSDSPRNRQTSGELRDTCITPHTFHNKKDLQQIVSDSNSLSLGKKSSVSSLVSFASLLSNSPAGKRPSVSSSVASSASQTANLPLNVKQRPVSSSVTSPAFQTANSQSDAVRTSVSSPVTASANLIVNSHVNVKRPLFASSVTSSNSQTAISPSDAKRPSVLFSVTPQKTENSSSLVKNIKLSVAPSVASSCTTKWSHSKDEVDGSSLRKLVTPPKPAHKPVVPPKPGSATKPTTPPKPGPKPVIPQTPDKPVPPPRPARKPSSSSSTTENTTDSTENTTDSTVAVMASCDKKGATNISNQASSSDHRRFSSLSANSCDNSAKDHAVKDACQSKQVQSSRESRHSLHSQSETFLKPLCATSLSTSVGVLVERKRSPFPKPHIDKQLNEIELPPRRLLHRSQSDLSSCRHSRASSDFSDLSSRLSRNSTEVERFFNEMGLDRSVIEPMRKLSALKPKECLDSLSSLDSLEGRSLSSKLSNDLERLPMESEQDLSGLGAGTTSVVERNARIIKWLCNVKKARTVQTKPIRRKPEAS